MFVFLPVLLAFFLTLPSIIAEESEFSLDLVQLLERQSFDVRSPASQSQRKTSFANDRLLKKAFKYRSKNKRIKKLISQQVKAEGIDGLKDKAFRKKLAREIRRAERRSKNRVAKNSNSRSLRRRASRSRPSRSDYTKSYRKKIRDKERKNSQRRRSRGFLISGGAGISQTTGPGAGLTSRGGVPGGSPGGGSLGGASSGSIDGSFSSGLDSGSSGDISSGGQGGGRGFGGAGGGLPGTNLSANLALLSGKYRLITNVSHVIPSGSDEVVGTGLSSGLSAESIALANAAGLDISAAANSAETVSGFQQLLTQPRTTFMAVGSMNFTPAVSGGVNLMHTHISGLSELTDQIEDDEDLEDLLGDNKITALAGTTITPNVSYRFARRYQAQASLPFQLQSGSLRDANLSVNTQWKARGVYKLPVSVSASLPTSSQSQEDGRLSRLGATVNLQSDNYRLNYGAGGSFFYSLYGTTTAEDDEAAAASALAFPTSGFFGSGSISTEPEASTFQGNSFVSYRGGPKWSLQSSYNLSAVYYLDASSNWTAQWKLVSASYTFPMGRDRLVLDGSFSLISDPNEVIEGGLPGMSETSATLGLRYNFGGPPRGM